MQQVIPTFCTLCVVHCAALATVEDGKLVKWQQDKESGFHYLPCPSFKPLANKEINEHPDRLKYPMKRIGARGEGKWARISWDEALDSIVSKLIELKGKYGPEYVAAGVGEPKGFEFPWLERFMTAFGSPNIVTPLALCGAAANAASSATYGPGHFGGGAPAEDEESRPKLVIVWGNAMPEKTGRNREQLKRLSKAGTKLVVIDPRRLDIVKRAALWIKPRPGSDPALAFGILKVLIEEELYDKDFVNEWTVGFDKLQEEIKKFTLDDVERVTWVPKKQIEQVARWYGTLKPSFLQTGMGSFGQGARTFQGRRILDIMRTIVTPKNLPGWGITRRRLNYVSGGKLYLMDKFPRSLETNLAKQHKYAVRSAYIPGQALVNGILEGKIKAAIFTQCDPLITYPNSHKTYDAFMKLDLLVSANIFMVPTTAMADVVLPVATTNECDIAYCFTGTGSVRAIPKLVEPPEEARSDTMILNGLAKKLGFGEYFFDSDVETINFVLGPSGLTWEELKQMRVYEGKTEKKAEENGYFTTSSGKAEIYSTRAVEAYGCEPLPTWQHITNSADETSAEYPLWLTSYSPEQFHLSKYKHVKAFRKRMPYPTVQLNPEVAEKIKAEEGDWVWIETKLGRIMQKLIIDPKIDPRVVMATFGFYFPEDPSNLSQWDKANINVLIPDEPFETASGAQETRGFSCRIYKAEESEVSLPEFEFSGEKGHN